MLEALLKHFRSYGMNDLEFMIVNSKLTHAQDKFHELQKRVSFPVYQETEKEEVWNLLDGGKDDMYIYDRCGRLTYFIPFPLSILNESPLVSNAILATYFQSPCGSTCDRKTVEVDEFVKNMVNGFETSNNTEVVEDVYEVTEQYTDNNETHNETHNETVNLNDLLGVIYPENEFYLSNSTDMNNVTDYDYPLNNDTYYPMGNDTSHQNDHNSTSVDKARTFFNTIYKLFFNTGNYNETNFDKNTTFTETQNNVTNSNHTIRSDVHNHSQNNHHTHGHHPKQKHGHRGKKKSDRCVEADYQVCKDWSKKRLLHAQKCCSETPTHLDHLEKESCRNYGKKRCKKIQSILKCCIKTEFSEPTPSEPSETTVHPTEAVDAVCCKKTDEGKFCRVSTTGDCEEERSSGQTK